MSSRASSISSTLVFTSMYGTTFSGEGTGQDRYSTCEEDATLFGVGTTGTSAALVRTMVELSGGVSAATIWLVQGVITTSGPIEGRKKVERLLVLRLLPDLVDSVVAFPMSDGGRIGSERVKK